MRITKSPSKMVTKRCFLSLIDIQLKTEQKVYFGHLINRNILDEDTRTFLSPCVG